MYLLLRTIDDTDGAVSQQSIADRIGLTKGAVSRHVATAQRQGWLVLAASPISRRENALALTADGRRLVERGRGVQGEYEQQTSGQLSQEEIAATVKTLSVICDLLEKEGQR